MTDYPPPPPPPPSQPGSFSGPPGSGSSGGPSGPRAGFWIRLGAAIIDAIVIGIVTGVLQAAVGQIISSLIGLLLSFAYFGYFEGGPAGQTPGKKVCGIRVVRAADGGALGWSTALLRHLYSYVSAFAIFIGYLWMLWDPEKQTWHDKWSGTLEVPEAAWPAPSGSFGKAPAG